MYSNRLLADFFNVSLGFVQLKTTLLLSTIILISFNNFAYAVFNAEELKSINYEIDILNVPVKAEEVSGMPVLHMTSKYGQQYQCQLPEPFKSDESADGSATGEPEIPDVNDLLEPLSSVPCLLKSKDWWTYEFCYGKHIRQYHMEDNQISGAILNLGVFDMSKSVKTQSEHEENSRLEQNRYHSHYYINGSKCDLTGKLRSSEIRFFCEPDTGDYIARVDEPETCRYIVTIHTSHICSHPHLKPLPSIKPHTIMCNPVLAEEHYTKYLQRVEEKEKANYKKKEWLAEQHLKLEDLKQKFQEKKDKHLEWEANVKAAAMALDEVKIESEDETGTIDWPENNEEEIVNIDGGEDANDVDVEEEDEEEMDFEAIDNLRKEQEKLFKILLQQKTVIKEAEEMLQKTIDDENKDEKMVVNTLNKFIDKLYQAEQDMSAAQEQVLKAEKFVKSYTKKMSKIRSNPVVLSDFEQKDQEDDTLNESVDDSSESAAELESKIDETFLDLRSLDDLDSKSVDDDKSSLNTGLEDDGKVRVRIRRVNSDASKSDGKLQWFRHKGLDAGQKQKLEDAVKEKLEQAGLDTSGRHIEVKIITAGYYDDEDGKDFHVLSDEETQQFQSMILTLLTRNQEARKEMDRHRKLEQNYQFKWSDDALQLQEGNEEELLF